MHQTSSELAGTVVTVRPAYEYQNVVDGAKFQVEDWWDTLTGGSWMLAEGNPAALGYAMRAGVGGLPIDNEVLYGKIGPLGYLIHISEIEA